MEYGTRFYTSLPLGSHDSAGIRPSTLSIAARTGKALALAEAPARGQLILDSSLRRARLGRDTQMIRHWRVLTPRYNRKGRWRGGSTSHSHPVISPGVAILTSSAASQDL